jgi:glycosyltransferase involved in cell wall biosynthesis
MKCLGNISIITVVYNNAIHVEDAIRSVLSQHYQNIEYIVVDGGSTDGTLEIIGKYRDRISVFLSEPDGGIYDALNKGFALATGDVIGIMHSDDLFADEKVIEEVATIFDVPTVDAVYGDLDYVAKNDTGHIIRHWRSGEYTLSRLKRGWMPPHPTLFLHRRVIKQWGVFDTKFHIAADYDAILRYFGKGRVRATYIPRVLVKMRVGGESNKSLKKIVQKSREDYWALKRNGVGGLGALVWKNLSKVGQFFWK